VEGNVQLKLQIGEGEVIVGWIGLTASETASQTDYIEFNPGKAGSLKITQNAYLDTLCSELEI